MEDEALSQRLSRYPALKKHVEDALDVVENVGGDVGLADSAEERLILAGRDFNRNAMQSWAENQVKARETKFRRTHKQAHKDSKKNSTGTRASEESK